MTDKFGGKVDVTINPQLTAFGRFGYRDVDIFDQPPIPLPSGGAGNARDLRHQQAARGRHDLRAVGDVAARGALRLVATRRPGKNPAALGSTSALDAYGITGLPTDPRVSGGLPTQIITGSQRPRPPGHQPAVAVPDGLQPEGQLHVDRRAAVAEDRLRVPAHLRPKCRTSTRSTAATPTTASSRGRPASPPTPSTTWPTSCSACAATYALSNILVANLRQNMHFLYLQDDCPRERPADAQPRPALRVRDAVGGEGQHPVELRSGDQARWSWRATVRSRTARRSSPIATTSGRGSASPTR